MEAQPLVLRKPLLILTALLTLALPAQAQADESYMAQRVAKARIALGAPPAAQRLAVAAARPKAGAAAECANADLLPSAGNLDAIRAAVICLHNQVRAENGLPALKGGAKLRRAAEAHSADMVQGGYFSHTSKSGASMVDRILRSGYVGADDGWLLGENLAWGTGSLATPRGAIDAWMKSSGHRANLLKRGYKHLGVGIALGVPTAGDTGATYTVDFGARL
jgi:uncharacterized protein YkwD